MLESPRRRALRRSWIRGASRCWFSVATSSRRRDQAADIEVDPFEQADSSNELRCPCPRERARGDQDDDRQTPLLRCQLRRLDLGDRREQPHDSGSSQIVELLEAARSFRRGLLLSRGR